MSRTFLRTTLASVLAASTLTGIGTTVAHAQSAESPYEIVSKLPVCKGISSTLKGFTVQRLDANHPTGFFVENTANLKENDFLLLTFDVTNNSYNNPEINNGEFYVGTGYNPFINGVEQKNYTSGLNKPGSVSAEKPVSYNWKGQHEYLLTHGQSVEVRYYHRVTRADLAQNTLATEFLFPIYETSSGQPACKFPVTHARTVQPNSFESFSDRISAFFRSIGNFFARIFGLSR